jgi:hypothetical protein
MKQQIISWAAWILARVQFVTAHFDPEVLQWPGGSLIASCLWLYVTVRSFRQLRPGWIVVDDSVDGQSLLPEHGRDRPCRRKYSAAGRQHRDSGRRLQKRAVQISVNPAYQILECGRNVCPWIEMMAPERAGGQRALVERRYECAYRVRPGHHVRMAQARNDGYRYIGTLRLELGL